jgi:hypothetical protein
VTWGFFSSCFFESGELGACDLRFPARDSELRFSWPIHLYRVLTWFLSNAGHAAVAGVTSSGGRAVDGAALVVQ